MGVSPPGKELAWKIGAFVPWVVKVRPGAPSQGVALRLSLAKEGLAPDHSVESGL